MKDRLRNAREVMGPSALRYGRTCKALQMQCNAQSHCPRSGTWSYFPGNGCSVACCRYFDVMADIVKCRKECVTYKVRIIRRKWCSELWSFKGEETLRRCIFSSLGVGKLKLELVGANKSLSVESVSQELIIP